MIDEGGVDVRRSRPAYRAGVWMFRLMLLVLAGYVVAMATGAVPVFGGGSLLLFVVLYVIPMIIGYVLFARAGVKIAGLPQNSDQSFGMSDEVKANRKLVWRDVFGRGSH
ncbi:hypothetical protein [Actinoplanes sp. NPDC026619]|uniref:hypothetical protein n=1 Tax=Actinoplanes sp. NPDC026619 TaxID=3155798 RepID=UPI0034004D8F